MSTQNSKVTFETFNDGICRFHLIDEDGNAGTVKASLRMQERTVGVVRYIEAMTAKLQIDRLVRVPYQEWLSTEYLAVIDGQVYEIVQAQTIKNTLPKCNDVSLHLARQRRVTDGRV